jgi:hypothetical protein
MVECGIEGICKMADGGEYKTELTKDRKTYQKIAMN